MPKIYLSPSTQEYNPYVTGAGSEEYFMNLLADAMEPILLLNGIQFSRNTPGLREADFELVGDEIPLIPLGRIAVPEDIANTVLFLVSESADYVTGQIVAPNGGRRMLI